MNEFQYVYLIQDIFGVLICALGIKFALLYVLILVKRKVSLKSVLCLCGNISLTVSGTVLIILPFGSLAGLCFLIGIVVSYLFAKCAYRIEEKVV